MLQLLGYGHFLLIKLFSTFHECRIGCRSDRPTQGALVFVTIQCAQYGMVVAEVTD
jgi:hypothetical protein